MLATKHISLLNKVNADTQLHSNIQLCFEILSLAQAIDKDCAQRLAPYELSESKFVLLSILNDAPQQQCFPNILADQLGISRATISGLLDGLEKSNYIQRLNNSDDKRKVIIRLTTQGAKILNQVSVIHTEWIGELFSDLTATEQQLLKQFIAKAWKKTDQFNNSQKENSHAISD